MNVLDRIKNGKSVVCDYYEQETRMIPGVIKNEQATAELLALAERGARYRWVPVSERLPKENQMVDAMADGEREANLIFYKGKFTYGDDFYVNVDNVTHWMPIPDKPEEETR